MTIMRFCWRHQLGCNDPEIQTLYDPIFEAAPQSKCVVESSFKRVEAAPQDPSTRMILLGGSDPIELSGWMPFCDHR